MAYDFDLFVIGGGSGGVRCARIAAGHGARVGIAEQRFWGGTCVNVGCVPKKLMVMAAEYGAWLEDSRGFGWEAAAARHDWAALVERRDREVARLNAGYRKLLADAGAHSFEAHAAFLDPHTLEVGGQRISAERIVIATGGRPQRPDFAGGELCLVSDDIFRLTRRPQRVVLIGGGYIAVEFASIFTGLGSEVELVIRRSLPLRGFDEDLRVALAEALEAQGVRLHRSATVTGVSDAGGSRRVSLSDGSALTADIVIAAIGRIPHTEGLGLERAGVETDAGGAVRTDAELRTSQPHIYALGDVTNGRHLTPVATAEGHALAETLFGAGARHWTLERVATAVFSSPPLATVGLTEAEAAARGPADIYLSRFTPLRHALSGRQRKTLMKLVVDQATQRVLGVHLLGEDAPEIMQGVAIALNCGATKADFDRTVGIHPTAAEELVTMRTRSRVAGGAEWPSGEAAAVMKL